ncbi:MAG: hypothetical protein HYY86_03495 [Candidatus Harrisonbacteria bacterium]|nr:hypothetical protein [Candidatus Harrisonbacteria bacterium]
MAVEKERILADYKTLLTLKKRVPVFNKMLKDAGSSLKQKRGLNKLKKVLHSCFEFIVDSKIVLAKVEGIYPWRKEVLCFEVFSQDRLFKVSLEHLKNKYQKAGWKVEFKKLISGWWLWKDEKLMMYLS